MEDSLKQAIQEASANGEKVIQCKLDNGVSYLIYIPENVNEDTSFFVYSYGIGGKQDLWSKWNQGSYSMADYASEQGSNAILIAPMYNNTYTNNWEEVSLEVINQLKTEYNITSNTVTTAGFSAGGYYSIKILTENLKQNPDSPPQVAFLVDDYSTSYYHPHKAISDNENIPKAYENAQILKDNNSIFFMLEPSWKQNGIQISTYYSELGINVVRVICEDGRHVAINNNFFKTGMLDYTTGKTALPTEGYTYQVYNKETGEWENIDVSKISTLEDLYKFYGIDEYSLNIKNINNIELLSLQECVNSNERILRAKLNAILARIKSSSFIQNGPSNTGFSSTSKIPTEVKTAINNYYKTNANLLDKMASDIQSFANIGTSINLLDQKIKKASNHLNNIRPIYWEEK